MSGETLSLFSGIVAVPEQFLGIYFGEQYLHGGTGEGRQSMAYRRPNVSFYCAASVRFKRIPPLPVVM